MESSHTFHQISPEDKFILACLSQSSNLVHTGYDEHRLLHRMSYHRVSAAVYHHLFTLNRLNLFSETTKKDLEQYYFFNISRNLKITFLVENIGKVLAEKDVNAIVLKGGALLREIPDYNLVREMADLDILVKHKDIFRSLNSLSEIGFWDDCSFVENKFSIKNLYKILFDNAISLFSDQIIFSNFLVELHWQFFSPANNYTLWSKRELWSRAKYIPEYSIYHLDLTDLLLHLCTHICNNFKIYLYGLFDISMLLKSNSELIDWDKIIFQARKQGILLHLVNVLRLCHELLDVSLSKKFEEVISKYRLSAKPGYDFLVESLFFHEWHEGEKADLSRIQAFRNLEPYNFFRYLKLFTPEPLRRKFMNSFKET